MAAGYEGCIDHEAVELAVASQSNLIRLHVVESIMQEPYSNLFEGGVWEANTGATRTATVPGRNVLNQNMANPTAVSKVDLCGYVGNTSYGGSTDYTTTMGGYRGRSEDICVHQAFHAVEGALAANERMLTKGIKEFIAADARFNALLQSGHKFIAQAGQNWTDLINGGDREIAVDFPAIGLPNSAVPHQTLVYLDKWIRDTADVVPFGSGEGSYAVYITSNWEIERMRNEAGLAQLQGQYIQGGDSAAKSADSRYSFAEYPYRGIKTAVDPRPLRFNTVDGDNFPVLIQPYAQVAADNGVEWRINPSWLEAAYEVSFLFYRYSFTKLVPQRYLGEGGAKFPQFDLGGRLEWFNERSQGCNEFGDFGHFIWEVVRAWEPNMPWAVCPILFKRCDPDTGLTACPGLSED
jgi:hypothetical protein